MRALFKGIRCEKRFDEPMSRYTSFGIGGKADLLVFPGSLIELRNILRIVNMHSLPIFVLGRGTNLLVRDKGIRGVVVSVSKGFRSLQIIKVTDKSVHLFVGAGIKLLTLVSFALKNSLSGAECLTGIPGSIGGALVMNAGTKKGEIKNIVTNVKIINLIGEIEVLTPEMVGFGYRKSNFPKDSIIIGTELILQKMDKKIIETRQESFIAARSFSQQVSSPNAGSIFKNPGGGKAYQVIDEIGMRGERSGGAQISSKHSNFIVNKGNATAKDVITLINKVKKKAKEKKGISMDMEIIVHGETSRK